ncbi:MAG: hypothetical protein K8R85_16905 [Bacteroidetes bacterium]|nr:hypothetical protein [Bacteroidota bacterium]
MGMKSACAFIVFFILVTSFANAQNKYKRAYPLKNKHFQHTASYSSGNAIIYIDRDSLIENLRSQAQSSNYVESHKTRIKNTTERIIGLSQKSDTTNVSSIVEDQEIVNMTLAYFSECIFKKQANVIDKRTNEFVKKIIVKKSYSSTKKSRTYAFYFYFLPNDKKEFMHRIERIGSGTKFL